MRSASRKLSKHSYVLSASIRFLSLLQSTTIVKHWSPSIWEMNKNLRKIDKNDTFSALDTSLEKKLFVNCWFHNWMTRIDMSDLETSWLVRLWIVAPWLHWCSLWVTEKGQNLSEIALKNFLLKFVYSEKVTEFCEIFPLLLTAVRTVKSKGKILQNYVTFSKYMNLKYFQSFL